MISRNTSNGGERLSVGFMSDFDGTAVQLAEKQISLQNMRKKGLPPVPGFKEFVDGVKNTGVPFEGFASKRAPWRTHVTAQGVAWIGLNRHTPQILAGKATRWWSSEGLKADAIIDTAVMHKKFGFIDDKPQNIGKELFTRLADSAEVNILLGAVRHQNTERYMDELARDLKGYDSSVLSDGRSWVTAHVGNSALNVVALEPYSFGNGVWFGETLLGEAA